MASQLARSIGRFNKLSTLSKHVFPARSCMGVRSYSSSHLSPVPLQSGALDPPPSVIKHVAGEIGACFVIALSGFMCWDGVRLLSDCREINAANQIIDRDKHEVAIADVKMLRRDIDAVKVKPRKRAHMEEQCEAMAQ